MYKTISKTFPRENAAGKVLFWPVMGKKYISHAAHTGKLHLLLCWLHLSKSEICAQPLYWGFFFAFVTCSCKNGALPLFSKTVVCCGDIFMPETNKKGERDFRKVRCNSCCLRKGSTTHRAINAGRCGSYTRLSNHILGTAVSTSYWEISCAVFSPRDSTDGTNPFEVLGSFWNERCLSSSCQE